MAKAINIRTAQRVIPNGSPFFIDTNVLKCLYSPIPLGAGVKAKAGHYLRFIGHLVNSRQEICVSVINLQELFHVFEKVYHEAYCNKNGDIRVKEYRRITSERRLVRKGCNSAIKNISEQFSIVDCQIEKSDLDDYLNEMENHLYEPIDFLLAKKHLRSVKANIITEDKDFESDDNVQPYCVI